MGVVDRAVLLGKEGYGIILLHEYFTPCVYVQSEDPTIAASLAIPSQPSDIVRRSSRLPDMTLHSCVTLRRHNHVFDAQHTYTYIPPRTLLLQARALFILLINF